MARPARKSRGRPHPGYDATVYRKMRARLKEAIRSGNPEPCTVAGPKCRGAATQPHHIVPLSKGGGWGEDNLTPSCSWCNNYLAHRTRRRQKTAEEAAFLAAPKPPSYYR